MSSIFPPGCTDSQCWDHSLGQGGIVCLSQAKWETNGPHNGCLNYNCYNMLAIDAGKTSLCFGMDLYLIFTELRCNRILTCFRPVASQSKYLGKTNT